MLILNLIITVPADVLAPRVQNIAVNRLQRHATIPCLVMPWLLTWLPRPHLNIKIVFQAMGISIIKIRWLWDHLIFIMGMPILERHLYIETAPRYPTGHILYIDYHISCIWPHYIYWLLYILYRAISYILIIIYLVSGHILYIDYYTSCIWILFAHKHSQWLVNNRNL